MAVHLYGVVPAGVPVPFGLRGVCGGAVRLVSGQHLAVPVTTVPDEYEPTEQDAREHLAVLTAFLDHGPVLPLAFGTRAPDDGAVEEVHADRSAELRRELQAREGLVEIHVDIADDEQARVREIASEERIHRALRRGGAAGGSLDYEIRLGELVATRLAEQRSTESDHVLRRLAPIAVADCPRGRADGWVLRWAFLLRREDVPTFDRTLERIHADSHGALVVTRVGPLPVLSFTSGRAMEQSRWGW